jgi:hypothetical protein
MTILSPFTNDKPFIGFRNGFLGGTSLGRRFNPRSLFAAGEQGVWYDPSDLSTLFQDSAGTTPVTVGDPVARINDKSGRGNHATQATAARRPILRQLAGGEYYLEFDGIDDSLVTSTITPGTDKAQVFAGVRKLATVENVLIEYSNSFNNANAFGVTIPSNSGDTTSKTYWRGADITITLTVPASPATGVLHSRIDNLSGVGFSRWNGGAEATETSTTGANFAAYPLFIGSRNNASMPFNGHIYGLVARFGANLDTATIEQTEAWLAAKTGVTL